MIPVTYLCIVSNITQFTRKMKTTGRGLIVQVALFTTQLTSHRDNKEATKLIVPF